MPAGLGFMVEAIFAVWDNHNVTIKYNNAHIWTYVNLRTLSRMNFNKAG